MPIISSRVSSRSKPWPSAPTGPGGEGGRGGRVATGEGAAHERQGSGPLLRMCVAGRGKGRRGAHAAQQKHAACHAWRSGSTCGRGAVAAGGVALQACRRGRDGSADGHGGSLRRICARFQRRAKAVEQKVGLLASACRGLLLGLRGGGGGRVAAAQGLSAALAGGGVGRSDTRSRLAGKQETSRLPHLCAGACRHCRAPAVPERRRAGLRSPWRGCWRPRR